MGIVEKYFERALMSEASYMDTLQPGDKNDALVEHLIAGGMTSSRAGIIGSKYESWTLSTGEFLTRPFTIQRL